MATKLIALKRVQCNVPIYGTRYGFQDARFFSRFAEHWGDRDMEPSGIMGTLEGAWNRGDAGDTCAGPLVLPARQDDAHRCGFPAVARGAIVH